MQSLERKLKADDFKKGLGSYFFEFIPFPLKIGFLIIYFASQIKTLTSIGGHGEGDSGRHIMKRLFTDELAEKYFWHAFKQELNFKSLPISSLIVGIFQQTFGKVHPPEF